jgi:hypothetical protein
MFMQVWADTPAVTTSVLKFIAELVHNRAQRISFGTNSPNGILLFREASNAIVAFGNRIAGFVPVSACRRDHATAFMRNHAPYTTCCLSPLLMGCFLMCSKSTRIRTSIRASVSR